MTSVLNTSQFSFTCLPFLYLLLRNACSGPLFSFNWCYCCLTIESFEFLIQLRYSLIRCMVCKYFLQHHRWSLHLIWHNFIVYFSSVACVVGVMSKQIFAETHAMNSFSSLLWQLTAGIPFEWGLYVHLCVIGAGFLSSACELSSCFNHLFSSCLFCCMFLLPLLQVN